MDLGYLATGGPSELGARLPSAICGTAALIVVYFMVGARFGRLTGFIAAMMLGTCGLFVVEARMATADATMLLCIVGCMACAWQAWDAAGAAASDRTAGPSEQKRLPRTDYLPDHTGDRAILMLDHLPPPAQAFLWCHWPPPPHRTGRRHAGQRRASGLCAGPHDFSPCALAYDTEVTAPVVAVPTSA